MTIPPIREEAEQSYASHDNRSFASKRSRSGEDRGNERATWQEALKEYKLTDPDNARRLAELVGTEMLYCPTIETKFRGSGWLIWDGRRYARSFRNEIGQRALEVAKVLIHEAEAEPPESRAYAVRGHWALQTHSPKGLQAMVSLVTTVAPELIVEESQFDTHPQLLNIANGVLDLSTHTLTAHDPALRLTKLAPVNFDPKATCPSWIEYLTWCFTDITLPPEQASKEAQQMIDFLARCWGYSLTGHTWLQVWFIPFGLPRSGKSTHNNIMEALLGEEESGGYLAVSSPELLLSQGGGGSDHERRLARLSRARVVAMTEINRGRMLDEAQAKRTTGSERLTARRLYSDEFTFRPTFKLWFSTNHKPELRQSDDATFRRIVPIPFVNQVPADEVDPFLDKRFRRELPGILNWALAGLADMQNRVAAGADALGLPPSSLRALAEYRRASDAAGEFIELHLTAPGNDNRITASDLFSAFSAWAAEEGYERGQIATKFQLTKRLKEKVRTLKWPVRYERVSSGMAWLGLAMNSPSEQG